MAVLSNIRQRSALMIAVIAFAFHLIYSLVYSGIKEMRKHQWQGYLI
jgi:hypothetical protein